MGFESSTDDFGSSTGSLLRPEEAGMWSDPVHALAFRLEIPTRSFTSPSTLSDPTPEEKAARDSIRI